MKYIADLHVHSKHSRATAKDLDLEHLYMAAQLKGIRVVATGDFTHPQWFAEIRKKLQPAEEGLFRLDPAIAKDCDTKVPDACRGEVRFILVTEISNIYKKGDKTRKNHNLVFVPDLEKAEAFSHRLAQVGNIASDGRPILGLDSRHLLEILLETSDRAFLIPAHIWTPWFSLLGSKSGFDSVTECFEDLSGHIFAVETGLSSDPAMNWRVSQLDRFTLVSNSDAHSPLKLGREANLFDTDLSYEGIRTALVEPANDGEFLGTIEFYPQEGKYHVDGHRKCNVRLMPAESIQLNGCCPECGKPLTLGVLHRVEELADRPEGARPERAAPFWHLIPLDDLLAYLFQVGARSKRVLAAKDHLQNRLGTEIDILHTMETDQIQSAGIPLLAEAIVRMRARQVDFTPGYDGEFGTFQIFTPQERESLQKQKSLFKVVNTVHYRPSHPRTATATGIYPPPASVKPPTVLSVAPTDVKSTHGNQQRSIRGQLNHEQLQAVEQDHLPLIIVAGPGTGKTHTVTQRIAHLIAGGIVDADRILAVTFTRKAAREMRQRLAVLLESKQKLPFVATFHALCISLLRECDPQKSITVIDDATRLALMGDAVELARQQGLTVTLKIKTLVEAMVPAHASKRSETEKEQVATVAAIYRRLLKIQTLYDFDSLIEEVVKRLTADEHLRRHLQERFQVIIVDEYQDLNPSQYRLVRLLSPHGRGLCVIGDPDQAIYGFRGAHVRYFQKFIADYKDARVIHLSRNYRSSETILASSFQVIERVPFRLNGNHRTRTRSGLDGAPTIGVLENATDTAEPVALGRIIEAMVGGTGFHAIDFGKVDGHVTPRQRSFADFAILYRTHEQGRKIYRRLDKAGIPCQLASRRDTYHAKGIGELMALIRTLYDCGSFADLVTCAALLHRGLGKETLRRFKHWAYQKGLAPASALHAASRLPLSVLDTRRQQVLCGIINHLTQVKAAIESLPVADQLARLTEQTPLGGIIAARPESCQAWEMLIDRAATSGRDIIELITGITLEIDTDIYDQRAEKVALMTLHAAKGLEFPVVLIAGCEAQLIPFQRSGEDDEDEDEERRLFYVAMTRAKEQLILSWCRQRRQQGLKRACRLSPFVADIDPALLKRHTAPGQTKRPRQRQLTLF